MLPSLPAVAGHGHFLTPGERTTLDAALARMIPAEFPDDWSAADVGAGDYVDRLLASFHHAPQRIYAGGPTREHFADFQELTPVKRAGWTTRVRELRVLYRDGLEELDRRAGGDFAEAPAPVQDAILEILDHADDPFFEALYHHTMEGVYGHPVYRGNEDYRPWGEFGYAGDVHGVRFPGIGDPDASWNVHGGFAPEEMIEPGGGP